MRELSILVNKEDVIKVIDIVNKSGYFPPRFQVGNCGWAKAPDCWYVVCTLAIWRYDKAMKMLAEAGIEILPPTTGY